MKLSISLSDEDVEFLDAYAKSKQLPSRSAAVKRAVGLLRTSDLAEAYEGAWDDWANDPDSELWESTVGDGLTRPQT
jgi:Arc/MetJ-type ribon-helix-helix transcriptional regulator